MNSIPVFAAWIVITIVMSAPNNEEALERMKNDKEIQELANYLRENKEEINRYLIESVLDEKSL